MKITGTFEYDKEKKELVFRSDDGQQLTPFVVAATEQEAVAYGYDKEPLPPLDSIILWFDHKDDGSDSIILITTEEP